MRVAIIGSRCFTDFDLTPFIPEGTTEIVSGGARGVDTVAKQYAVKHGLKLREFLPEYNIYGAKAPLVRNISIIRNADIVLAFWDGESHGTRFVIDNCKRLGVPCEVYMPAKKQD